MHQSVLMNANINEGAEVGYIGNHAFQHHAGFEIRHFFHTFLELCRLEFRPWIPTGFFQFPENVANSRQTKSVIGVPGRIDRLECRDITHDLLDGLLQINQDALYQRIGFWMHRRSIKWIVTPDHAQKSCCLFIGLVTQTWHLQQLRTGFECAMLITKINNVLRDRS